MLDFIPKALASVASFLFPLFASYKALKTADPAELTPWLMYWVVLACALLAESWTDWLLVWVPFYAWLRLFFLLYLVLPQTQGARVLYQTHLHPWLAEHEAYIDELIGSAHERLRTAGLAYLKRALAYVRASLGLQAVEPDVPAPSSTAAASAAATAQSYTQALLARFSLPSARWGGAGAASGTDHAAGTGGTGSTGTDYYSLLASAVGAVGSLGSSAATSTSTSATTDRASFVASQRDRLRTLLSALDREAAQLEASSRETTPTPTPAADADLKARRLSGLSGVSGLSKSRSEADFEKIDAESGAEDGNDDDNNAGRTRRRTAGGRASSGSWMPWGWGGSTPADEGTSSAVEK